MKRIIAPSLFALLAALALPAQADSYRLPKNAVFEEECSSCHIAFPPQMLHADSWRAMMGDLSRHFGSDASIDEKHRVAITDFLVANAGGRKTGDTRDAQGKPLLRITETARFAKKHREISAATWKRPSIKSPANCAACHPLAAAGEYSDHSAVSPK
ncbi:MAG: diheme cytochrome c [Sulfuritalea sp.]|jgi:nitrate/TMAO reductase-like tetraheme cytochrome c subunit|nr:diheme cytochrome c [Sulfuritalea sp.]